jgi:GntR family transcriptional regulator, transcriptional repressor for pyruvate dehydrogenase complex
VQFTRVERDLGLTDRVANQLLEMIAAQQVRPGDRLPPEREIGEALGVSRTVVREAIRALSGKGVLSIKSGSGVVVTQIGTDSVAEAMRLFIDTRGGYVADGPFSYDKIHEVREMLEVRVAGVAAERATDDDLEELRAAFRDMTEAADSPELSSIKDVEFHRTIAKLTHNDLYMIMLDSIGHVLLQIREETLGKRDRRHDALGFHRRILEAIERGDAEGARKAMADHLEDSANVWRSIGKAAPRPRPVRRAKHPEPKVATAERRERDHDRSNKT